MLSTKVSNMKGEDMTYTLYAVKPNNRVKLFLNDGYILNGVVITNDIEQKVIYIRDMFYGNTVISWERIRKCAKDELCEVYEWEPSKMPPERFKELLDELDGNSLQTLKEKNARYSTDGDCLHNFRSGAEVAGGTPAQACWGYMTKHLVALRDMVEKNDFSNREDFLEKCQDTINYIRFLWCIGNDASNSENKESEVHDTNESDYHDCPYLAEYADGDERCAATKEYDPCNGRKCSYYKTITK